MKIKCVSCGDTVERYIKPELAYICPKCADKCIMELFLKSQKEKKEADGVKKGS
jgi:hypothetical protein